MGEKEGNQLKNHREYMVFEHIKSKTPRDISLKVRFEQSKTTRMNAMLFLIAFLLLIGLYALIHVNLDFDYEPFEADFKQRISSIRRFDFFSDDNLDMQMEKELIVENGLESS